MKWLSVERCLACEADRGRQPAERVNLGFYAGLKRERGTFVR
jgi:hypothetical protein